MRLGEVGHCLAYGKPFGKVSLLARLVQDRDWLSQSPRAAPAPIVHAERQCDVPEPAGKPAAITQLSQALQRIDQRLLRHVLRIVRVAQRPIGDRRDGLSMSLD